MLFKRSTSARLDDRGAQRLGARWHQLNQPFTVNDFHGPDRGPCTLVEQGRRPIVFSAPHAVHHSRNGAIKSNDANTGGLALALADHLDASAIALRRGGHDFGDPNHDLDHPLKVAAESLVRPGVAFADLHGMADRELDVIIGLGAVPTSRSQELAERFVTRARRNGIAAAVADEETGFNGRGPATMTTWAQSRGADALQFEIARNLRSVKAEPERRAALLHTFVEVYRLASP